MQLTLGQNQLESTSDSTSLSDNSNSVSEFNPLLAPLFLKPSIGCLLATPIFLGKKTPGGSKVSNKPSKKYPMRMKGLLARFRALERPIKRLAIVSFLVSNWFFITNAGNELFFDVGFDGSLLLGLLAYVLTVPILTSIVFFVLTLTLQILEAIVDWFNQP